jgi:hypothetical protein
MMRRDSFLEGEYEISVHRERCLFVQGERSELWNWDTGGRCPVRKYLEFVSLEASKEKGVVHLWP